ncbi:MAG: hypothetical protein J7L07_08155 [Candidatus Odinarchaeota archaeon]|nr:hypothetical protein [Candidatus Odinarchaeota archaeon]
MGKIHRVRLSDKEIEIIREALQHYLRKLEEKTKRGEIVPNYEEVFQLTLRFIEWGFKREYYERPYYKRPRKAKSGNIKKLAALLG